MEIPQTLDNLEKSEKDKVVDMLRQLKSLRNKCDSLEKTLEEQKLENQRLQGREEGIKKQLSATQSKLFEAIEVSKQSQNQYDQINSRYQKELSLKQANDSNLQQLLMESSLLKEKIEEIKGRHEHVLVDVGVMSRILLIDKSANTHSSCISKQTKYCQYPEEETLSFNSPIKSPISGKTIQTNSNINSIKVMNTSAQTGSYYMVKDDDDISDLIAFLNPDL